jgi:hypothetical protein
MWYKKIELPSHDFKKLNVYGRYEQNIQKAKRQGIRYKKIEQIRGCWFANPGIAIPYSKYIAGEPAEVYRKIRKYYLEGQKYTLIKEEYKQFKNIRKKIKYIFELDEKKYKIIFEANGSVLVSLLTKLLKNENNIALTFSDQGRLIYAALAKEEESIYKYVANFEQQIRLFEAPLISNKIQIKNPYPEKEKIRIIDIFNPNLTYKSDAQIIDEYSKQILDPKIKIAFLLEVSRTGRILPIEELIKITRQKREDILIFVDGAQAIGRLSYEKIKRSIKLADGYLIVGHKALDGFVSAAMIIKNKIEELISKSIDKTKLFYLKIFRFESDELNEKTIFLAKKQQKEYYLISLPEAVCLKVALEDNKNNFFKEKLIISPYKQEIAEFLNAQKNIYLNVNRFNCVDDIIAFHTFPFDQAIAMKDFLQSLNPSITVAPLTENLALRIGLDAKLPDLNFAIKYLKDSIKKFYNLNRKVSK